MVIVGIWACACTEAGDGSLKFPKKFLFGTAIAGFQADMGCPTLPASECDDPNSDWYQFITSPITLGSDTAFLTGHPPSAGPGHWELYEKDFDLAVNTLHNNAMRFSIEWSRIFPTATDGVEGYDALRAIANSKSIQHYHDVLAAMKTRGLKPLVTLNHYTLPMWLHDGVSCHQDITTCTNRGWVDRERAVREIAKYAGFCAKEFGGEIDLWATLNEPFAVVLPGYIFPSWERSNPPAVLVRSAQARTVLIALIEAHARMYDAVKAGDTADADGDGVNSQVGVVYAMTPIKGKNPEKELDVKAAENAFYLWNLVYLNGVIKGELDENLDGVGEKREDLMNRMDYVGINYYTRATVASFPTSILPDLSPLLTLDPTSIKPWEDYPKGLYEMAMYVKNLGLPMMITENGAGDPNDDGTAPSYLVRHITWLHRAIEEGADVRGYFYWTLMDNYEWNHGMDIRMGMFGVDRNDATKTRVTRKGAITYGQIAESGGIPKDLLDQYPIEEP